MSVNVFLASLLLITAFLCALFAQELNANNYLDEVSDQINWEHRDVDNNCLIVAIAKMRKLGTEDLAELKEAAKQRRKMANHHDI